jgi:hypothetical protein
MKFGLIQKTTNQGLGGDRLLDRLWTSNCWGVIRKTGIDGTFGCGRVGVGEISK